MKFLQRFRDDKQVICTHVFSGRSCTKLLGEGFQNHKHFNTEPFTHIATNMHSAPGILYMICMGCSGHSSTLGLQRAHQMTRLCAWSNATSRLTRAMYSVLLMAGNFCCSWCTVNMEMVVQNSGMEPKCMSSMAVAVIGSSLPLSLELLWLNFCYVYGVEIRALSRPLHDP